MTELRVTTRDFLGHANITQTSTYLKSMPVQLARAIAQLEDGAIRTPFGQTAADEAHGGWSPACRIR